MKLPFLVVPNATIQTTMKKLLLIAPCFIFHGIWAQSQTKTADSSTAKVERPLKILSFPEVKKSEVHLFEIPFRSDLSPKFHHNLARYLGYINNTGETIWKNAL